MARKSQYSKDYRIPRLCRSIETSLQMLQSFREERAEIVRKAAGNHYGASGGIGSTSELRFVNWLSQYRSIVARQLVAKNPRVMISTFNSQARPICSSLERWANDKFDKIYLGETLLRLAYDALDGLGIALVGLADPADAARDGYRTEVGEPFIARVDLEDFAFDHRAKSFAEATWLAHHFRCPVDVANAVFMKGKKEKLEAQDPTDIMPQGDDRIGVFSYGNQVENDEYEEYVSLWQVYLPRDQVILTLRTSPGGLPDASEEPLRVQRWIGPECGPYHFLAFQPVPGSAMPKPPVYDLVDLDDLLNLSLQKLADQAGQQKTFIASSSGNPADGDRARSVKDGDVMEFDDAESIREVKVGGPDQTNFAFSLKVMDWLNRQSGNLDTMAGLAQSTGTARQEALLNENSSKSIADLLDAALTFTERVMTSYLWLHYHHPLNVMDAPYSVPGYEQASIVRKLTPEQRYQVPWDEIELRADPFARQHLTPEHKIAAINSILDRMGPREQFFMQQGVMLDAKKYLELMAKYMDTPEISDLYSFSATPNVQQAAMEAGVVGSQVGAPGQMEAGGNPNPSEATSPGQSAALMQQLMGGNAGGAPQQEQSMEPVGM